MENELVRKMIQEISEEIDREIIRDLQNLSTLDPVYPIHTWINTEGPRSRRLRVTFTPEAEADLDNWTDTSMYGDVEIRDVNWKKEGF